MERRMTRRQALAWSGALGIGMLEVIGLAGCAMGGSAPASTSGSSTSSAPSTSAAPASATSYKMEVWGPSDVTALKAELDVWNKNNPNIQTTASSIPGGSTGSDQLQKFLTAAAAGTAADVDYIDRFQLASLAFRGALSSVDDYAKRDNYDLKKFYPEILKEAYGVDQKLYGLPNTTDDRILWWNKDAFSAAGLDPNKGPSTYADLKEYAVKLTKTADDKMTQLGWNYGLPGVGVLYQYGWEYGGHFLSPDGRKSTMNDPKIVEGVQAILDIVDAMGGAQKIAAFTSSFQTKANDPFIIGKQIMAYGFELAVIDQYKPNMNFGYGMFPVVKNGDQPMTFSGGFAWVTPAHSKHPDGSWQLMSFLVSRDAVIAGQTAQKDFNAKAGQSYRVQWTGQPELDKELTDKFKTGHPILDQAEQYALDAMKYTRVRPISPAALEAWDQLVQAWQIIFYHKQTVQQALDAANAVVQKALDEAYASQNK